MRPLHAFLVGAALVAVAWLTSGLFRPAPDPGPYPAAVAMLTEQRDTARALATRVRAALDSAARAYSADSLRWERSRVDASRRAQVAAAQAREARETLAATLDSVQAVAFEAYVAARDSVDAANDETITGLVAERATLLTQLTTSRDYESALRHELEAERTLSAIYQADNSVLRATLARTQRKGTLARIVGTAGAGYVCADAIARDRITLAVGSCAIGTLVALGAG